MGDGERGISMKGKQMWRIACSGGRQPGHSGRRHEITKATYVKASEAIEYIEENSTTPMQLACIPWIIESKIENPWVPVPWLSV